MKQKHVIIIGGGASGMTAAITASKENAIVTIIERNNKMGKKILATGNGRCNFLNVSATPNNYNHPDFVSNVFNQYQPSDVVDFFESLGIVTKVEELGKAYPLSEQASSITDVLIEEINRLGILVIYEKQALSAVRSGHGFTVYLDDGNTVEGDALILCTGGLAMPISGSDGSGYHLASDFGHELTPLFPSLIKLHLDYPHLKLIDGVKIPGKVSLIHKGEIKQTEIGDILFTKYGISGPTILQLSRLANALMLENETVTLSVTLVNQGTKADLYNRFNTLKHKRIEDALIGLINKKWIPVLLIEAKIAESTLLEAVPSNKLKKLVDMLFDFRFKVTGSKGYEEAQVTAGGIKLSEINSETLESKRMKGLFFAGEIVDIDALCGGYNLLWAWSSGMTSGYHASK